MQTQDSHDSATGQRIAALEAKVAEQQTAIEALTKDMKDIKAALGKRPAAPPPKKDEVPRPQHIQAFGRKRPT